MTSDLVLLGLRAVGWVATVDPTVWLALGTGIAGGLMLAALWKGWV